MTIKKLRFLAYASFLASFSCFPTTQIFGVLSYFGLTGAGSDSGDATYRHSGEPETTTNFDYRITVHRPLSKPIKRDQNGEGGDLLEEAIDQHIDQYRKNPYARPADKDVIRLILKFSNPVKEDGSQELEARVAEPSHMVIVDKDNNTLSEEEAKEKMELLPFGYEHIKTLRCSMSQDQLKPGNLIRDRRASFGQGNAANFDTDDGVINYRNNSVLWSGMLTLKSNEYTENRIVSQENNEDNPTEEEKFEPSIRHYKELYKKLLKNADSTLDDTQLSKQVDKLTVNPYSLSLENHMLETYEKEEDIPIRLRCAFPSEVKKFMQERAEYRRVYLLFKLIYDQNKSYEAIAEKLIEGNPQAVRYLERVAELEASKSTLLTWRTAFTIGKYILIMSVSLLVVYKILSRLLDKVNNWLFPEVNLEGVSAYSMETNNLVNIADWFGSFTGRVVRSILRFFRLWKPKAAFDIASVFYPTENTKKGIQEYLETIREVIQYNNEEVAAGRIPDNIIPNKGFFGPPGTGKTLSTKALAETLKAEGLIDYIVIKVTDVLGYKSAYMASALINLIKARIKVAKRLGKAFCIVLQEMDSLGKRHDKSSSESSEVRKTFLQGLVQMFDAKGDTHVFIMGTMNVKPREVAIVDAAFMDRIDFLYMGYPNKKILVDIFMYWLKKHAKKAIKIEDTEAIKKAVADSDYIQKAKRRTGRHMDEVARAIIVKKRRELRTQRKDKKVGKGVLFAGDVTKALDTAYQNYLDTYEESDEEDDDEEEEQN